MTPAEARPATAGPGAREAALVAAVAADPEGPALAELVERYSRPLYGLGMRLLGDRGMAEDLVQDTMLRVWRGAGTYDPARGSVRTFVYTIARRAAIDMQRRGKGRPVPAPDEELAELASVEDGYERITIGLDVRDAMRTLSEDHRQALELFYDEDLSQRQIAERTGVPLGTVKTRTYHALRALRTELEGRGLAV